MYVFAIKTKNAIKRLDRPIFLKEIIYLLRVLHKKQH